jgi:5-methylthioadenosine/S-adenosylhomocysteine deaminase
MNTRIQHVDEAVHDLRPHTRDPEREGPGAQKHHGSHDLGGQRFADGGRMAAHDVALQGLCFVRRDANVRQTSEPGRDAVHGESMGDRIFDHPARRKHLLGQPRANFHPLSAGSNADDVLEPESLTDSHTHPGTIKLTPNLGDDAGMPTGIRAERIWDGERFATGKVLVLEGGTIEGLLEASDVSEDVPVDDWGDVALMPGTVNAHGHAFQSLLKGFADDRTFDSWRDDVLYPFSERLSGDDIYAGALFAFAEALLAGVTTIVDFFYLHDAGNENAERVIQAAHDVGISLVLARAFYDPDAPTKAPARYREPAVEAAERLGALIKAHRDDPLVSVQPAPHSLHAASPETICIALDLARDAGIPCHLHLAEARYEVEQVKERYGTTPVRLLAREGLLDRHLLTIHTVWVDDMELDLLADSKTGVVHCPGANAFLGDGIARIPEMLEKGIRVALGPDGGCANNRQSIFDEMRTAGLVAKARLTDGSALGAPAAFRLGTSAGAELLGVPAGEFAPGRRADIVALDLDDLSLWPRQMLERHVVNSLQATAIAKVMVAGEVVAEHGELTRFPLAEVRARVQATTDGWTRP